MLPDTFPRAQKSCQLILGCGSNVPQQQALRIGEGQWRPHLGFPGNESLVDATIRHCVPVHTLIVLFQNVSKAFTKRTAQESSVIQAHLVEQAHQLNSQPDVIAKNISKRVGGQYSVSRAMTIARTETHKAANTAQYHRASVAAQESELEVVVEWISTNDGRVRDDHKNADGQTRPIGQPFNVGGELLMYPSDPKGSAANVINCRCVLGYDTK